MCERTAPRRRRAGEGGPGLAKAGNARVRRITRLAFPPVPGGQAVAGSGTGHGRRTLAAARARAMIVALARKLLIALWGVS